MKQVFVGNDHAGPDFVEKVIKHIQEKGYAVEHVGSYDSKSVNYPDYGFLAAQKAVENNGMGVVICGNGVGITMAANKVKGARAANCVSPYMAEMTRRHNNANILGLGARDLDIENAKRIVDTFFSTPFDGDDRHVNRVEKLNAL